MVRAIPISEKFFIRGNLGILRSTTSACFETFMAVLGMVVGIRRERKS
jgi:hypothetical protein